MSFNLIEDRNYAYQLVERYERLMYKIARQYFPDASDCEDIVQESLIKILERLALLQSFTENQQAAYIAAVVKNRSINLLRRKNLENKLFMASLDEKDSSRSEGLSASTDDTSMLTFSEALLKLSPDEQYLIEGRYIIGLTDAEMAVDLGCQPASVRMKLTKARRSLLKMLARG